MPEIPAPLSHIYHKTRHTNQDSGAPSSSILPLLILAVMLVIFIVTKRIVAENRHMRAERCIPMRRRSQPANNKLHDVLVVMHSEVVDLAPTDIQSPVEVALENADFEEVHD
jgi:hypothetical protein